MFGVGEHHRSDFVGSAPTILLAAAAEATERIRLTSSVTVLCSEDPVRVWEQFATIDLLSSGRAEIIAGRGSYTESFPLFGYDLDDYADLCREKLDLLLKIRAQNPLTWQGRFRAPLVDADVAPRADGDTIPIWVGVGGSPASAISTGRLGLPMALALLLGPMTQHAQTVELYRAAEEAGHDAGALPISINTHGYVGRTSQQARDEMYPYFAEGMMGNHHQRGQGFLLPRVAFDAQTSPGGRPDGRQPAGDDRQAARLPRAVRREPSHHQDRLRRDATEAAPRGDRAAGNRGGTRRAPRGRRA